ncbi:MAG: CHASE3 domain-containing protein, partial [Acidobacteriota bacterium]
MKLGRKLDAAFATALVIVVLVTALSWIGATTHVRTVDYLEHTHEITEGLDAVLEDMIDVETGARGFALTGRDEFLEPYTTGSQALGGHIEDLRTDVGRQLELVVQETWLEEVVRERLEWSTEMIATRRTRGLPGVVAMTETERGKRLMDTAREIIAIMRAGQQMRLRDANEEATTHARIALALIAVSAFGMVFLVAVGMVMVRRSIVQPLAQLANAARRTGRGDWRALDLRRSDEIGELERALAQMTELRRDAEQRLRELVSDAPEPFFLADLHGRYTDVNSAACALLGYTRDELLAMAITDLIPAEDVARLEAERSRLLEPGAVLVSEWPLRAKSGELIPVEVSAKILDGERWQAFVRDLRDRKRLEEEKLRVIRSREQMIAVVSHDLKNPLNAIELRERVLERRTADPAIKEHSLTVRRTVATMQRMIRGLLDAASIQAGKLKIVKDEHDLADLI